MNILIPIKKLYSNDLDEEFCSQFGLSDGNMKKLKEDLYNMEIKGEKNDIFLIDNFF